VLILKKNKRKAIRGTNPGRCPYCGSHVILRSADGIYKDNSRNAMLYVCSRYPACDAYVRTLSDTKTPAGTLANGDLRALRREAHRHFDRLHKTGIMSRKEAYEWLAAMLRVPLSQTHIGYLGEYYCRRVIEESLRIMENRRRVRAGRREHGLRETSGGGLYAVK
jgi:hypothetical protein